MVPDAGLNQPDPAPAQPAAGQILGQPDPGQALPGQAPSRGFPGQPNSVQVPGQAYPGQPYPGQAYPGQAYPGQAQGGPYPSQAYPMPAGQPYPGEPMPGFWPAGPVKPSALPVVEREYHEFFRTPRFRWWKPLLAMGMFLGSWIILSTVISFAAIFYDLSTGRTSWDDVTGIEFEMTPMLFLANNIVLGLAIPLAGLSAWAVFGQRPRWLSSVTGGFRWRLFWRCSGVALAIGLANLAFEASLGSFSEARWNPDSLFLIFVILLTTPFQAAGEEYAIRGLLTRSVGSWFGFRRVGLVVAMVVSSLVFMALHGADNLWLNLFYFCDGVVCSVLVWKTGGLEAAVAQHVFNNLIAESALPFTPLGGIFDRGPQSAGPEVLIQVGVTVAVGAALLWVARRSGAVSATAPGATVAGTS